MFPVPTPPASVVAPPAHAKPAKPSASVMRFPSAPLAEAESVTVAEVPPTLDAVTPRFALLFRLIAATKFVAVAVGVAPIRKLSPVFKVVLAVSVMLVPGLVIVAVWPLVGCAGPKVPVRLAAVVGDTPARLVLYVT